MVMSGEEVAPNLPEDSLITRAVAGDKDALVVLLYRYYDVLAADLPGHRHRRGRSLPGDERFHPLQKPST